jgi:ERAP1-like C-terminal domain
MCAQRLMLMLVEKYIDKLGYDDLSPESALDTLSRVQMIDFVCRMKSKCCLDHMHSKLKSHIDDKMRLPVNSELSVFCFGLMASAMAGEGPRLVEALWREMQASESIEYRARIIQALGCYEDEKVLLNLLETIFGGTSEVRYLIPENFQVIQSVFASGTTAGVEATLNFMIEYTRHAERRSQTSNLIEILLDELPSRIHNQRLFDKVSEKPTSKWVEISLKTFSAVFSFAVPHDARSSCRA